MPSYEVEIAIAAVIKAAQLCEAVRADLAGVAAIEKDDRSPVTIADFGSQAVVCHMLKTALPDVPIVGEEDSADLRRPENAPEWAHVTAYVQRFYPDATPEMLCEWIDAGNGEVADRFWTLDPIDGTKGFLRDDQYAIALALIEDGEVTVGVLGCPALPVDLDDLERGKGVIFVAVRGKGTQMARLDALDFTPVHVAHAADAAAWRFVESVESAHGDHALQEAIAQAAGITRPPLRMDSQVKYGAVARGDAVLYLRLPSPKHPGYREKIWDHAAGTLVVEEAGGRVTDMHGRPLDLASAARMNHTQGVVVSNGVLHAAVLDALTSKE
ncbi:MAG: 3'(2'),5'-bisphosphate nucleotidase [Anaerolineae bacterium]|nr:3'(2'),5'-bisphosphate nucleotidase [Anaerolineae bacterium]